MAMMLNGVPGRSGRRRSAQRSGILMHAGPAATRAGFVSWTVRAPTNGYAETFGGPKPSKAMQTTEGNS